MKTQQLKTYGYSKSSPKREVYSNTILPQETRKTSYRQPKFTLSLTIATKGIKYLGINLTEDTKSCIRKLQDTDKRNQRWHKQMERYFVFLGRKNQYCENNYTTKCNLQIQCNPYQITNDIFHRSRTKNFTIHMETQKTLNSQSNLERESTFLTSDYTTKLQSSRQYDTGTKTEI